MSSSGRNSEEQQKRQQQQQQQRHEPGMSQETRQDRISEPPLQQGQQGGQQRPQQQGERGQQPQQQQSGSASGAGQYGEGNYKATRDYDSGVKHHLETHDVEREARDAAPRSEQEKRDMERAEQRGKDKAEGMRDPKDDMKR